MGGVSAPLHAMILLEKVFNNLEHTSIEALTCSYGFNQFISSPTHTVFKFFFEIHFAINILSVARLMMNCFCGMVDQQRVFSLISSWDYCERSSPSRIFSMTQAGFEPVQNLSSDFVE